MKIEELLFLRLSPLRFKRILDVGCGYGRVTSYLKIIWPNAEVIALDLSRKSVPYFKKAIDEVNCLMADGLKLPLRDEVFDLVTTHAGDKKNKSIKPALVDKGIKVIELDNYTKPFTIPRVKEITRLLEIVRENDILYFNNALAGERIAHESCEDANKDNC
jgi:SAM-dependent methyltransferase